VTRARTSPHRRSLPTGASRPRPSALAPPNNQTTSIGIVSYAPNSLRVRWGRGEIAPIPGWVVEVGRTPRVQRGGGGWLIPEEARLWDGGILQSLGTPYGRFCGAAGAAVGSPLPHSPVGPYERRRRRVPLSWTVALRNSTVLDSIALPPRPPGSYSGAPGQQPCDRLDKCCQMYGWCVGQLGAMDCACHSPRPSAPARSAPPPRPPRSQDSPSGAQFKM